MKREIWLAPARNTAVHRVVAATGQYEPEVMELVIALIELGPRSAFLDIGSNIGVFPLAISSLAQSTGIQVLIHAHEPLPMLREVSNALMKLNGLEYNLHSTALSDFQGRAEFYVSSKSDSSNSLVAGFRPSKDVISVDVDTVDQLYLDKLVGAGIENVIMMLDVETAEPNVLRGSSRLMRDLRPFIICEVLAGRTEKPLQGIFDDAGYIGYRFNGEYWVHEPTIAGDPSYTWRDWLFLPTERASEFGSSYTPEASLSIELRP